MLVSAYSGFNATFFESASLASGDKGCGGTAEGAWDLDLD